MEIWKEVKDYEGRYEVSNLGNVKSLNYNGTKKEKLLKQVLTKEYLIVSLHKNGKQKSFRVHKLVAIAFLNHTPCGHELVINHKNFIKTDNRVENLEIVTQRENANHKHIKSSSQYVGVHWCKNARKWRASIHIDKKLKDLGLYINEIDAHNAYQNKLKCLNTI